MGNDKIDNLKKGIDGMRMYLSTFTSLPKKHIKQNWHFIQETTKAFFNALSKCGLNFSQVWTIMEDVFCSIKIISMNNKHLEIDRFIKGVINKAAQNEQQ